MHTLFHRLFAIFAAASLPAVALASTNGSDNAGNYTSWTDTSNQGTGFGAWTLVNNNAGGTTPPFAGHFIGSSTGSTGDPGSGNINSSANGSSFGMYANPNGAIATASRSFAGGALSIGQTFTLQLAVNFRNGAKGFSLTNGGNEVFNFNIGGDQYSVNSVNLTLPNGFQSDSDFSLSFTQYSATTMSVAIVRSSSAGANEPVYSANLPIASATGFQLYNTNTTAGGNVNNLYANNFAIIPEPSTVALLGVGCLAALAALRRRRV